MAVRRTVPVTLDVDSDTPHADYLFVDEYETTRAELHDTNGNWMLHIHCKKEVGSDTPGQATNTHGTVLGVDLGVNNLAVTSTGTFWTGDEFDHWRREYENRRGSLQQCATRWAHENMKAVGRKEEGRFKMTLHRLSNELGRRGDTSGRSTACTNTPNTKPNNTVSTWSR